MPTFRVRWFVAALAFGAFAMGYLSVGIRWHTYRAQANLYADREVEHTFEAANLARAARAVGYSDDALKRAASYRKLAQMHTKAAAECAKLREFYEQAW